MRLTCPSCGAVHSAEAWTNDGQARQCLLLVAELPTEVSRRAVPYIAMFRPSSGRGLQWSKALRLLAELRQLVMDAQIQWDRRPARPNSAQAWAQAMEQVIQHPPRRLPLTSHGYLHSIAYDLANEADRRQEIRHNEMERAGRLPEQTREHVDTPMEEPLMTLEQMRAIREERMGKNRIPNRER
ncbi:MAG: hypothetical protein HY911_04400 [Desulfobacterales bacterium]|nr:hypothetical protein [Desulfobacterales bacterium]